MIEPKPGAERDNAAFDSNEQADLFHEPTAETAAPSPRPAVEAMPPGLSLQQKKAWLTRPLTDEPDELEPLEPSAYEEQGGGNLEEFKVDKLRRSLGKDLTTVWNSYRPAADWTDHNMSSLTSALATFYRLGDRGSHLNVHSFVTKEVGDSKKKGFSQDDIKFMAGEAADSLGVLQNAFYLVPGYGKGGDGPLRAKEFISNHPSPLWRDDSLRPMLLRAVDSAHQILEVWLAGDNLESRGTPFYKAMEGFIKQFQDEFLLQGGVVEQISPIVKTRKQQIRRARQKRDRAA